jgi:hypothetical protein
MLPADVTATGDEEVPEIKPFKLVTGPEKVVDAMISFLLHEFHLLVYATSAGAV